MKRVTISFFVVLLILSLVKCSEIFLEDISGKNIQLVSPSDNLVTETMSHNFWWKEVEGAKKYNLQIVQPNFSNPKKFVLDTNISGTRFAKTLFPGDFQWRVKAFNTEYETPYAVRSLSIDSTTDLSNQYIVLTAPKSSLATQDTNITFSWDALYNADEYRFIVKETNWQGAFLVDTLITSGSGIELTLDEGPYAWGVRAQNQDSHTNYETRKLEIDYTAPQAPVLLNPADEDTVNTALVTFQWKRPDRSGTSINDSLVIAQDSSFTDVVFRKYTTDTIYNWNPTDESIETYYWKVRSVDRAGNQSPVDNFRTLYRDESAKLK